MFVSGAAVASEDHFSVDFLPPIAYGGLFSVLLLDKAVNLLNSFRGESVLGLLFDEGEVAVFVVLGHKVSNKAGKVATAVSIVQNFL